MWPGIQLRIKWFKFSWVKNKIAMFFSPLGIYKRVVFQHFVSLEKIWSDLFVFSFCLCRQRRGFEYWQPAASSDWPRDREWQIRPHDGTSGMTSDQGSVLDDLLLQTRGRQRFLWLCDVVVGHVIHKKLIYILPELECDRLIDRFILGLVGWWHHWRLRKLN